MTCDPEYVKNSQSSVSHLVRATGKRPHHAQPSAISSPCGISLSRRRPIPSQHRIGSAEYRVSHWGQRQIALTKSKLIQKGAHATQSRPEQRAHRGHHALLQRRHPQWTDPCRRNKNADGEQVPREPRASLAGTCAQDDVNPRGSSVASAASASASSLAGRGPADDPVSAGNDDGPISGLCSRARRLFGLLCEPNQRGSRVERTKARVGVSMRGQRALPRLLVRSWRASNARHWLRKRVMTRPKPEALSQVRRPSPLQATPRSPCKTLATTASVAFFSFETVNVDAGVREWFVWRWLCVILVRTMY